MVLIGCLHTAESNVVVFEAAAEGLGIRLEHHVRPDLLEAAEAAGGLTAEIVAETAEILRVLAEDVDVSILTCSTLGPVADLFPDTDIPALRADAVLAEKAVASGRNIAVLCAAETTLEPTGALFERVAITQQEPPAIRVYLVNGAWDAFKGGDIAAYHQIIAEAADGLFAEGADLVALAQASMAGAALLTRNGTPLTSPRAALEKALAEAERQNAG